MGIWDKIKSGARAIGNFISFGSIDRHDAKKITNSARTREEEARDELENQRTSTEKTLAALGDLKNSIYQSTMISFAETYKYIGKIDLNPLRLAKNSLDKYAGGFEILKVEKTKYKAKEIALYSGGAAVAGATAVMGAMGLAGLVGVASTGTAIGTLSGVAATNATLAWLGGGALSAGGAGAAGGIVVLGGVALAPLVIVTMFLGVQKGKQNLNNAKAYSSQVDALIEKIYTLITELSQIRRGAELLGSTIKSLNDVVKYLIEEMNTVKIRLENRSIISKMLVDPIKKIFRFDILTTEEKTIVTDCINSAILLNQLIEKPLMNAEGAFMSELIDYLESIRPNIQQLATA